jgi:hypothetical protein
MFVRSKKDLPVASDSTHLFYIVANFRVEGLSDALPDGVKSHLCLLDDDEIARQFLLDESLHHRRRKSPCHVHGPISENLSTPSFSSHLIEKLISDRLHPACEGLRSLRCGDTRNMRHNASRAQHEAICRGLCIRLCDPLDALLKVMQRPPAPQPLFDECFTSARHFC